MSAAAQLAREYELVYILRPTTGPAEARKVADRVTEVIEKGGAKLTRVDNWGKRRLAYPIQKHTRGIFVHVKFVAFHGLVAELERNLRIQDTVVRYQTVKLENLYEMSALSVDPTEVEFHDIEETAETEDDEPTFEEQLGMGAPRARASAEPDDADDSDDTDDTDDNETDDAEDDSDSDEETES
ncbi:MAG: 30S ribosomal protein S6 [Sandaracinaceae bacterium]